MFFSIIIPTYNPGDYLRILLESITHNECKDDIEVIIADDISTEDFSDTVNEYLDKLHIIQAKNKVHFGAPLGGRQGGSKIATGQWICFADQDDYFIDGALDEVKNYIIENDVKYNLITDFYGEDKDTRERDEYVHTSNWSHGKFYEKTFWDEANINYEDIRYCEDIALSVSINCEMAERDIGPTYYPFFTYVWLQHEDSLSRKNGFNDKSYFYKSFPDYIKGTLGQYIKYYEECSLSEFLDDYYKFNISSMMFHLFFYYQGMLRRENGGKKKLPRSYYALPYKYFKRFLKRADMNLKEYIKFVYANYITEYDAARRVCLSQIPFLEKESFKHWIKMLHFRSIF